VVLRGAAALRAEFDEAMLNAQLLTVPSDANESLATTQNLPPNGERPQSTMQKAPSRSELRSSSGLKTKS
jgi:hypothetical protein